MMNEIVDSIEFFLQDAQDEGFSYILVMGDGENIRTDCCVQHGAGDFAREMAVSAMYDIERTVLRGGLNKDDVKAMIKRAEKTVNRMRKSPNDNRIVMEVDA